MSTPVGQPAGVDASHAQPAVGAAVLSRLRDVSRDAAPRDARDAGCRASAVRRLRGREARDEESLNALVSAPTSSIVRSGTGPVAVEVALQWNLAVAGRHSSFTSSTKKAESSGGSAAIRMEAGHPAPALRAAAPSSGLPSKRKSPITHPLTFAFQSSLPVSLISNSIR